MKETKTNLFRFICILFFAMSILSATSCNTKKEAKEAPTTEAKAEEKAEAETVPADMKTITEMGCSFYCPNEMEQMKDFDGNVNKEEGSGFLTVGGKPSFTDAINYEVKTIDKPLTKKDMEEGFKQISAGEKGKSRRRKSLRTACILRRLRKSPKWVQNPSILPPASLPKARRP